MADILSGILDDVIGTSVDADQATDQNTQATAAIKVNNAALDTSYAASAARAQLVQQQTQVIKSTQEAGALVAQTAAQSYAHNLGINADGTLSDQQAKAQQIFLDASQSAQDAAATIAQKRSVSFFDDPLQWLSNKVSINDDINNYNGAANQANTAEQFIQESNQLIDARTVALNAIKTTTSQAVAEAATNVAVEQQQEIAETQRRAGIAANTQGVEAVSNMSWRNIQIANAKFDSQAKYVQMLDDQKRLQMQQAQFGLEQKRLELETMREQDKVGADQYMQQQLVKGLQLMFPKNPAAWNVPPGKYQAWLQGKGSIDPTWLKAFNVAQATDETGTDGSRILGTSPADALGTLAFKPTISPTAQPTVDLLQRTAAAIIQSQPYKSAIAAKDINAANGMINDAVNRAVASDAAHTDSPTSLYYLPPADTLVKTIPSLQDSPVYQTVLAPAIKAGVSLDTPDQVAGIVQKAIAAGTISLNDGANGIANIYTQGQKQNFAAKQIFSLGIVAPQSYTSPASGQSALGLKAPVDWTNAIQVKENLMRRSSVNQIVSPDYSPI